MSLRHENDDGRAGEACTILADLASETNRLLLERLRGVLWICLVVFGLFALADLRDQTGGLVGPYLLKVFQVLVALAALDVLRRPRPLDANARIGAAVIAMIYITTATASGLRGSYGSSVVMLVVCCMGSAMILPWGARCQLATVVAAALALLANVQFVDGSLAAIAANHSGLGVAIGLLGSVYVAHEQDRHRHQRERVASRLAGQSEVLEMIARDTGLSEVLDALTTMIERQATGLLCSVLILEGDRLRHRSAPSLPESYSRAIDGIIIGPNVGSCGSAAYRQKPVVVTDIARDPLWEDFRELALSHGLRACWSAPIMTTAGRCLGTFAMYYREPRGPEADDWRLVGLAAHLAGIAIERSRAEETLAASRRKIEEESHVSSALVRAGAEMMTTLNTPLILERLCQLMTELLGCDVSDTMLRDPDEDVYVPRSGHGYSFEEWESFRLLRIPGRAFAGLLANLRGDAPVQFKATRVRTPLSARLLAEYGITVSMYVPLRRGGNLVGFLSAAYRGRTERFSAVQERIARGVGQLAAMALENARLVEELKSASQLKSEFVSTMSHELRTPLSVIIGYADMLADDPSPDERVLMLNRVRRSSRELLEMIEATLNLNRLEAGRDPAQIEVVSVPALFEELESEFAALPRAAKLALHWDAAAGATAWTDRRKLRIVLKNLVGNALKFTAAGEIRVTCRLADGRCAFTVRDTGIGIASEHLPIIFDMFRQADSSYARSHGGVGLGLYIVQRILAVLGGTIDVTSELGRGTTFTVTVPSVEAAAEPLEDARA